MVHLIFVCKYRKKLLSKFGDEVKALMYDIADRNDFRIIEMEIDKDHIHLLIEYNPTQSILKLVRLLKQVSIYRIWRQNNNSIYLKSIFGRSGRFGAMDILLAV